MLPHPEDRNRGTKRAGGNWHLLLAHRLVGRAIDARNGAGPETRSYPGANDRETR